MCERLASYVSRYEQSRILSTMNQELEIVYTPKKRFTITTGRAALTATALEMLPSTMIFSSYSMMWR